MSTKITAFVNERSNLEELDLVSSFFNLKIIIMPEIDPKDVFRDDIMYLPIQYHNNQAKQPSYQGRGNHSVKELEDICEQYKEYTHQQAVIKQNAIKHLIDLKFK